MEGVDNMAQHKVIDSALEPLRAGLAADHFELKLLALEADGRRARVNLHADPDACLDCLIPEELLIKMIGDCIRKSDPTVEQVELIKTGFETATHSS
jgi:hypothetical protein